MTASLTGRYSHPGNQALIGVEGWVEDTNKSDGVWLEERKACVPVRLVSYDDGGDPQRCAELTARLIVEDRVDVLLGPYSSGLARSAALVAREHRRVLWNQGGASEAIYEEGNEWVVGILTPPSWYFHGIIDMVCDAYPSAGSVAVAHSTAGAFPRDVASGAVRHCRERGFDTVRSIPYRAGTTDFGPILGQIERDQPDLVLSVGRVDDDVRFARQLVISGIQVDVVGLIATPLTRFRETLGDAADGFLGPSQWEPGVLTVPDYGPTPHEVLTSLSARHTSGVDYPMAQAYAGCLVARRCVEEASGSLDNYALRQAASRLKFTTFYGRFDIEPTTGRQLGHVMPVVQWRHGEKAVVWPPEMR